MALLLLSASIIYFWFWLCSNYDFGPTIYYERYICVFIATFLIILETVWKYIIIRKFLLKLYVLIILFFNLLCFFYIDGFSFTYNTLEVRSITLSMTIPDIIVLVYVIIKLK